MLTKSIATQLANGSITLEDREDRVEDIPWSRHPKFKGVYLRHLVKGADTGGTLSCHVVRLDPGAILEDHIHESQWELHEVVEGAGRFFLGLRETAYYPGRMAVIPRGAVHRVVAGASGLVLLAKFVPPLV